MRDDFKKVLCEKPRRGRKGTRALNKLPGYKKKAQKASRGEFDEWSFPHNESMRAPKGWYFDTKASRKHIGPLVRFLRSSVGRKWDDVYSEFTKAFPKNGAISGNASEYLWNYVERFAEIVDGKPYDTMYSYKGKKYAIMDHGRDNSFYVDQEGVLRRAPRSEYTKNKHHKVIHKAKGKLFLKFDGIWYEGLTRPLPQKRPKNIEYVDSKGRIRMNEVIERPNFNDIFIYFNTRFLYQGNVEDKAKRCQKAYGKKVYCYNKRQLSSKELRRLGLRNNKNPKKNK